jgi:hypothetical protein
MTEVFRIASMISGVSENPEIQNLAYEVSIYSLDHEWNGEQNTEEESLWYRKYHKVLSYFEIEEMYFSLIEKQGEMTDSAARAVLEAASILEKRMRQIENS